MYIEECRKCKYFINKYDLYPKAIKFGSREMGYCSYHPKNSRKEFRAVQNIKNCKLKQKHITPKLKWCDIKE